MSLARNSSYVVKFETGAATHVGKVRRANEDSYIVLPELGIWAVADGVGGHEGGQFASQTVAGDIASVGMAVSQTDQLARFKDRILRANDTIKQAAAERGAVIGTTVAAILAYGHNYSCVWAGDSRVYHIRDETISQLTRDHTEAQELVDNGTLTPEQAKTWPRRNVITRAIGIFDDPDLDDRSGMIKPGDAFLLCSDGLTGHLSDAEICEHVSTMRAQDACDALIAATLERGASDNVTIVIVRCHAAERTNYIPASGQDVAGSEA
ncbi:PP2C family protein-serine/threonine phosphatase [Terrarubrum flagellatum]|uniref:PP2C family protein-serine/threonine phosphatase n=1 Tax=Terrirubrum flagellatum TaxID=2895980 RepID=UPI003144F41C